MPDHTLFTRLLNAIFDAGKKPHELRYWRLLPDLDKERLEHDSDYVPPWHWIVGIADEIPSDLHLLVYGDEMALTPPIDAAAIEQAREFNAAADSGNWSWRMREILWNREVLPLAARPVATAVRRPLSERHWRKLGASYAVETRSDNASRAYPADRKSIVPLRYCERCPLPPFVATKCPMCGSDERLIDLR